MITLILTKNFSAQFVFALLMNLLIAPTVISNHALNALMISKRSQKNQIAFNVEKITLQKSSPI